jgi:hypothetical protein
MNVLTTLTENKQVALTRLSHQVVSKMKVPSLLTFLDSKKVGWVIHPIGSYKLPRSWKSIFLADTYNQPGLKPKDAPLPLVSEVFDLTNLSDKYAQIAWKTNAFEDESSTQLPPPQPLPQLPPPQRYTSSELRQMRSVATNPTTTTDYTTSTFRHDSQRQQFPNAATVPTAVEAITKLLRLRQTFPGLDRDLLTFAIFGDGLYSGGLCTYDQDLLRRLKEKYCIDTCDNRILESFGDQALDAIVTQWMMGKFRLTLSVRNYLAILAHTVSNFDLSSLSLELGICQYMGLQAEQIHAKHNVCANGIETILGCLFFVYGLEGLPRIKEWFLGLPTIASRFGALEATIMGYIGDTTCIVGRPGYEADTVTGYPRVRLQYDPNLPPDTQLHTFAEKGGMTLMTEDAGGFRWLTLNAPGREPINLTFFRTPEPAHEDYIRAIQKLFDMGLWIVPMRPENERFTSTLTKKKFNTWRDADNL